MITFTFNNITTTTTTLIVLYVPQDSSGRSYKSSSLTYSHTCSTKLRKTTQIRGTEELDLVDFRLNRRH